MPPQRQQGFVLAAVLWALVVVTLGAAFFADRVSTAVEEARTRQDWAGAQVQFANSRAEILFRLSTTHLTRRGLGDASPIYLDETPYRMPAGDIVRLQDELGLLNLNAPHRGILSRLLALRGVPAELHDSMLDTLSDFTDSDDLRRLNGAESADYRARGLPPPPNERLFAAEQVRGIIAWRDRPELWSTPGFLRFFTVQDFAAFNPNTAPAELIAALPGVSREGADAVVARRRLSPLSNPIDIPGLLRGALEEDFFAFFPSGSVRISQQAAAVPWSVQTSVTLTPRSEVAPWRIDSETRMTLSSVTENDAQISALPAWAPSPPAPLEAP